MIPPLHPFLAANAAVYAIENATTEGKTTVCVLLLLSMFSWTIIITKFRQLYIARRAAKKFFAAYSSTRDPLDIKKRGEEFPGRVRLGNSTTAAPRSSSITSKTTRSRSKR